MYLGWRRAALTAARTFVCTLGQCLANCGDSRMAVRHSCPSPHRSSGSDDRTPAASSTQSMTLTSTTGLRSVGSFGAAAALEGTSNRHTSRCSASSRCGTSRRDSASANKRATPFVLDIDRQGRGGDRGGGGDGPAGGDIQANEALVLRRWRIDCATSGTSAALANALDVSELTLRSTISVGVIRFGCPA